MPNASSQRTPTRHALRTRRTDAFPQEREAKFGLLAPADSTILAELLARQGATFGPVQTVAHIDVYLDTPSFDLYRRGLSLRLRHQGDAREVGLKQIGSANSATIRNRMDFSVALDAAHDERKPATWPAPIVDALRPYIAKLKELQPLVELHQTRHKQRISSATYGDDLVEWSVDRVEVRQPTEGEIRSPVIDSFDELELELLQPEASDIFSTWVQALEAAHEFHPVVASKFARGLQSIMQQRCHPGQDTALPTDYRKYLLAEACRSILCEQVRAILLHEADVREGKDPEAVHDMRVAIRRARAALHLFGHSFRRKPLRLNARRLRDLGRALGPVRDLDVALENLRKQRKKMPADERRQLQPLRKTLRARRKAAHAALIKYLDGDEHRAFIKSFTTFCTTPGQDVKTPTRPSQDTVLATQVRHTMPSIILHCFEQVRAYETVFEGSVLPPLATFHSLRIQVKYLRYSLEFAADLLGEPGQVVIAQLKDLQDHLGALNDTHVEQLRLSDWTAALKQQDIVIHRAAVVEATQHELMKKAPSKLAQVISPQSRRLLGAALANI